MVSHLKCECGCVCVCTCIQCTYPNMQGLHMIWKLVAVTRTWIGREKLIYLFIYLNKTALAHTQTDSLRNSHFIKASCWMQLFFFFWPCHEHFSVVCCVYHAIHSDLIQNCVCVCVWKETQRCVVCVLFAIEFFFLLSFVFSFSHFILINLELNWRNMKC